MYKKLRLALLSLAVFLLGCVTSVFAQAEKGEIAEEEIEPIAPPRLFVAPTAGVIRSLDIALIGGGAFGAGEAEQSASSFLGGVAFGLADIAQLEIGTIGVTGAFRTGVIPKPAPGFKIKLLPEGRHWPGIAASVRVAPWTDEEKDTGRGKETYSTRTSDFYVVASKTVTLQSEHVRSVSVHGGLEVLDARLKSGVMERDKKMDPTVKDVKKSILAPFAGLEIWVTERGKTMIEVGRAPRFRFDRTGIGERYLDDDTVREDNDPIGEQNEEDIREAWIGTLGVRFFLTRYVAADVGVTYRSDFEGVSDTLIGTKLEISIPTHKIYEGIRQ